MRYHTLDIWRGIACLIVVVFHSTLYAAEHSTDPLIRATTWGWIGVPMFFVISGFCIAAAADNCRAKGHSARTFFWRRFRRIYPPYWACLLLSAAFVGRWLAPFLRHYGMPFVGMRPNGLRRNVQ